MVSLLNYPDVVKMMSEDLDWTQSFGNAIAYQQKDVLIAIQQLRDEAVAGRRDQERRQGAGDCTKNENVVIPGRPIRRSFTSRNIRPRCSTSRTCLGADRAIIPTPIRPTGIREPPFFAGAVTGANLQGAVVDWDDWGVWGGDWDEDDLDIDCNNCFNNRDFNGKLDFNDIELEQHRSATTSSSSIATRSTSWTAM